MPVFALYNFDDATTVIDDATGNGQQNGYYYNSPEVSGGLLHLNGVDQLAKVYADDSFQMDRGTLEIQFTPTGTDRTGNQTVLSRDSTGEHAGSYKVEITPDGALVITHELNGDAVVTQTDPGFFTAGDTINLTYSWDQAGEGGSLVISNLTTGTGYEAEVPASVTMDMGDINQPWFVGAGQSTSDPSMLNNIDQHFQGNVDFFSISDTVDNWTPIDDQDPVANPDQAETDEDTPVTIDVLSNDTDPQGQPLTVTSGTAGHGTVAINEDGTLTYTPDADWNGTDEITYTVTDPDGNTASSTVTVVVNPVNDDPVANDDAAATTVNVPVVIAPLLNDTDVDGDTLAILGTPSSANGTISVNDDGTLTFTPNPDFVGEAVIDYEITDGNGGTDTAQIIVTVSPATPTGGRDGIVTGTDGDDEIVPGYTDHDGDQVDAEDAIIPGDGPNDDRIYAGGGNDTVRAGEGDDLVYGGAGDDLIYGGPGNDTLYGGDGRDTVYGGNGDDVIDTSGSDRPLPDIDYPGYYEADPDPENDRDLVYGGRGNDTIRTGDDADTIYGGAGNDWVDGGWDADLIYGNSGNDTLIGNEGADTIYGGAGDDLIYGGLGEVGGDALDIPDDRDLRPQNNTDLLYGGRGNDTIYGRDDNDTLYGGAGDDLLYGGIDNDVLHGDAGNDTLHGDEGDDTLYGGAGDDVLYGGEGLNLVYGGAGADTIRVDTGGDTVYGGADRDVIVIANQGAGIGTYVDGNEEGDDWDTLDLSDAGPVRIVYDPENEENGRVHFLDADGNEVGHLDFRNIERIIKDPESPICFTPGTLIATPRGEVPVESLRAGDRIITRDNGIQEIRWIGEKVLSAGELLAREHLQPVLVKAHSLGYGLPERDMLVSPNHRLLVANERTQLNFDEHEVLVAAKHMVGAKGIQRVQAPGVTYVHFLCDQHEVVLSNGAWTETFQPGDFSMQSMGSAQQAEIFELFPELKTPVGLDGYLAARRTLKRHEALILTR